MYTDRSKEPTFRKHHVESLERRLRQAEAKNEALAMELARSRATSELRQRSEGHSAPRSAPDLASVSANSSLSYSFYQLQSADKSTNLVLGQ